MVRKKTKAKKKAPVKKKKAPVKRKPGKKAAKARNKDAAEKKKEGRPTDYHEAYPAQAYKLCLLGTTDVELARFFDISERTLNLWKKKHPEFMQSLRDGKESADSKVADRLLERAMGYEHPEVHISNYMGEVTLTPITKKYPPDTAAAIFWLKNRQGAKWRDRQELSGPDGGPVQVITAEMDPKEAASIYKASLSKIKQ